MNEHQARLARLLVAKSYKEGDFTLTSGKKSEYYFDCKQTALHPEGAWLLGNIFLETLDRYHNIAGVGGMTLGADPLVSAVTVVSYMTKRPLPGFIIRKQPKGHGTAAWLEGITNFTQGDSVVLLEDVVTTGGTLITSIERVQEAGFHVAGILCVLDRQEGGRERLEQAGHALVSLFTRSALLEAAQ